MRRGDGEYEAICIRIASEPIKPSCAVEADRIIPLVHDNNLRLVCLVPD